MAEINQEITQTVEPAVTQPVVEKPVTQPVKAPTSLIIGDGKVSINNVVKTLEKNVERYMDYKGYTPQQKDAFLGAYADFVDGLQNGQITGRGYDRKWNDNTGKRKNAEKGFDAYGEVAALADKIVSELGTDKSAAAWSNVDFTKYLKNKLFAGDVDEKTWNDLDVIDTATNKRGTANRTAKVLDVLDNYIADLADKEFDFKNSPFKDKEDLINKLTAARQSIQNGVIDNNAYYMLNQAGVNTNMLRQLLNDAGEPVQTTEQPADATAQATATATDPAAEQAVEQAAEQTEAAQEQAQLTEMPIVEDATTQTNTAKQQPLTELQKRDARVVGNLQQAADQLTASDYVRLGAAAADITSAIAAWAPGYGTAISAITGVGSSLATLGADIGEDGFQWHDLASFGANLAMDAAGLFGGAGKAGKIIKSLTTLAPKAIVLFDGINNGKEYAKAFKKAVNDTEHMTMADWKLVGQGLTLLASGSRMGASSMKQRAMVKMAEPGKPQGKAKLKIKTTEGEKTIEVEPEFAKKMHAAKTREEAQALLNERFKGTKTTTKRTVGPKDAKGRRKHTKTTTEEKTPTYTLAEPGKKYFGKWGTDKSNPVEVINATLEGTPYGKNNIWPAGKRGTYNFNTEANRAKFGGENSILRKTFLPSDLDIMTGNIKNGNFIVTALNAPYLLKNAEPKPVGFNPYVAIKKQGGVLKAQPGAKAPDLWADFVAANGGSNDLYGSTAWDYTKRYRNGLDAKKNLTYIPRENTYNTDKVNPDNGGYDPEAGNGYDIERKNNAFYQQFKTNRDLAEKWAREYMRLNTAKNGHWSDGWFKNDEFQHDVFLKSKLWNDQKNGIGHDVYKGAVYYVDGHPETYFNNDLKSQGYKIAEGDEEWDDNGLVRKYKLVKDEAAQKPVVTNPDNTQNPDVKEPESEQKPNGESEEKDPASKIKAVADAAKKELNLRRPTDAIIRGIKDVNYYRTLNEKAQSLNEQLAGLTRTPLPTPRSEVVKTDNYAERAAMENANNQALKQAELNRTSNAKFNSNMQLGVDAQNEQRRYAVNQQAAQLNDQYVQKAVDTANTNRAAEIQTLNTNNAQEDALNKMRHDLMATYINSKQADRHTFLQEHLDDFNKKENKRKKAIQLEVARNLQDKYYGKGSDAAKIREEIMRLASLDPKDPEYANAQHQIAIQKALLDDEQRKYEKEKAYYEYQLLGIDPDSLPTFQKDFSVTLQKGGQIRKDKVGGIISYLKSGDAVKKYQADKRASTAKYVADRKNIDNAKKRNHDKQMQALKGIHELFLKSFDL